MFTVLASTLALASNLAIGVAQAAPMNLLQAYQAALQNDPTYRGAIYENQAGQEARNMGRSYLLPKLSSYYTTGKNQADITQTGQNILGQPVTNTSHSDYSSVNAAVTLRQPIVNFEALALYNQGVAKTNYSNAQFVGRSQDLMLRLVAAYAEVQYSEDQLTLAAAQRDAYREQMHVNERLFKQGEGTKTDMLETEARANLAEAQVFEAQDNVTVARNTLTGIVGVEVTELAPLNQDFRLLPLQPANFQEWRDIALAKNAEIIALGYAVDIAHEEINRQRAGHAPSLDLVGSFGKQKSTSTNTINQDANVHSIGVELNIPLFSGGYVSAATRQAVANHEKARSDLDVKINQVSVELRKQFSLMQSAGPRIDALVKSADSASLLIVATKQSIKGGVRINLDLLNAEQQLYTSRRDLALARYNYLLAYLRMRSAAGTLNEQDLGNIAGYFVAAQ
ncbi:MAG: TolC family outer membrane protein [Glaciimonas sp.]|nr:TolC family outer membrane protein [Glaciimonas sp.]